MTDQYREGRPGAGELYRQFKLTGTHPQTGDPVYAEVMALEAGSIGSGGGGGQTDIYVWTGSAWTPALADVRGAVVVTDGGSPIDVSGPLTDTELRFSPVPVQDATLTGNVGGSSDAVVISDSAGTVNSKLRGLVKWAYERMPAALGQTTKAGSIPVTLASDQGSLTTSATQSGTWTVQPGNTANTTAWKVDASGVAVPVTGTFWQATQPVSGTFWQATQPVSGTVAATQSGTWTIKDGGPPNAVWAITNTGAAAGQATITKASAGLGIANVCTAISIVVVTLGTAPTAANVVFNLRDGGTGAGTILWSWVLRVPAVINQTISLSVPSLFITGTTATAMTLETSASVGTNVQAIVNLSGTTL